LWTTGISPLEDGNTVVRIRGGYSLSLVDAAADNDGFSTVGIGIGVVTINAFAAGAASVPGPLTDIGWEGWMYHKIVAGLKSINGGAANETWGNSGSAFIREDIDSKAMRKLDSDVVLVGVVEMGTEVGTATAHFSADTRILFKLP